MPAQTPQTPQPASAENDAADEEFSLPEQRHRLMVLFGGRTRWHIIHDSTFKSSKNPGRWTRRGVERRSLCGSLRYVLVGVDAAEWPTERQPVDTSRVNCVRCLDRYASVIPPDVGSGS